ncbi:MAG: class I SAM-dependent methyltransferase [Rhodobacteraceae bacterium]|jgi:SAM-dependent methyltransferase|nr:class I SAM-dependent methyltransferase [Paracoccaceae bacterium]
MWNERYAAARGYLFGTEAADFVKRAAPRLRPGARVLCLADGEGRNSVYLAGLGMSVTATDYSDVAQEKARALALARGVSVDFRLGDIGSWVWEPGRWDAVLAVFIQFAEPPLRDAIFAGMQRTLAPGGLVLLHGYTPRQIGFGTGGPKQVDQLYTTDLLREKFGAMEILRLAEYDAEIHEGEGHSGQSALIDLIARKPAKAAR